MASKMQKQVEKLTGYKPKANDDRQETLATLMDLLNDSDKISQEDFENVITGPLYENWYDPNFNILDEETGSDLLEFPDWEEEEKPASTGRRSRRGKEEKEKVEDKEEKEEKANNEIKAGDCEVNGAYLVEDKSGKLVEVVCTKKGRRIVNFETDKGEDMSFKVGAVVYLSDNSDKAGIPSDSVVEKLIEDAFATDPKACLQMIVRLVEKYFTKLIEQNFRK